MKPLLGLCFTLLIATSQSAPVGDLYLPYDDVEILNTNTFKQFVENSTSAWLVEFYASWCGYCQRFAPHWKEFATEAASWRDIVRVGVMDCSEDINIPICRDFTVGYPTVRYLHENYQHSGPEDVGIIVPHQSPYSVENVKKNVIETFVLEQREGRGTIYPNLIPYVHPDLKEIFTGVKEEVQYVFLVVDESDHFLGAEVFLDFHRTSEIAIRYAFRNNSELVSNLKIETYPYVTAIDRNNNQEVLKDGVSTKKELKATITSFLAGKSIKTVEITPSKLQNSSDPTPDPHYRERTILRQHVKKMGDVVFQRDLEAALRYSLQQEVSTVKVLKGEQLEALNTYLKVVRKYFPFGYNSSSFIDSLVNLTSSGIEVEGPQIEMIMKEAEQNRVFSSRQAFLGCLGSSSRFRGYPCSLWRMFHYFTVNSLFYNTNNKNARPREVLDAMHGYVKNFFSCVHCAEHFQKMAAERKLTSVESLEEAVLWLWESHNVVNARLHKDPTEDPEYIKEQFPTKGRCAECYEEDGSWKKTEVLKYLKRMYGPFNVRYIGTDTTVLFPGLE